MECRGFGGGQPEHPLNYCRCAVDDIARRNVKQATADLRAQLEAVTRERDILVREPIRDMYDEACDERDTALERERRLREALPDPQKMETLATWLDVKYPDASSEVQEDLRTWARLAREALNN